MAYNEKLSDIIALGKYEVYYTIKANVAYALLLPILCQGQYLKC